MLKRFISLVFLLVVLGAAVFAQTDFTVSTYIATATTASETTVRTARAPMVPLGPGSFTTDTFIATATTASRSTSGGGFQVPFAGPIRITEANVGSSAGVIGFLRFNWDPSVPNFRMLYTNATGTHYIATISFSVAP